MKKNYYYYFLLLLNYFFLFLCKEQLINKIKIFTIQKNTGDDLKLWTKYHGEIFGYSELHIIDHQSTDSKTLIALDEVKKLGVTIHKMEGNFDNKHKSLSDLMNSFKNDSDFLIPIDIDEFIGLATVHNNSNSNNNSNNNNEGENSNSIINFSIDKEMILEEFTKLPRDGRAFKFIQSLSRPLDCDNKISRRLTSTGCSSKAFYTSEWWTITENNMILAQDWKTFYLSKTFLATDQGNHFGSTTSCIDHQHATASSCWHITNLILFHYHVKSYFHFVSKILSRAHTYHFTNQTDCEAVPAGKHYCERAKVILSSKDEGRHNFYRLLSCESSNPIVSYNEIYQKYCN